MVAGFCLLGVDATLVMGVRFDKTCTVSEKWNVTSVIPTLYGWVYKRLSPVVVEHIVVVMTAVSQSRQSQIESYG